MDIRRLTQSFKATVLQATIVPKVPWVSRLSAGTATKSSSVAYWGLVRNKGIYSLRNPF